MPVFKSIKRRIFVKRSTILELDERPELYTIVSSEMETYKIDVRPDISDWLKSNAGEYQVLELDDRMVICFLNPEDAFAFKMRWF